MPRTTNTRPDTAAVATLGLLVCLSALAIDVNIPVLPLVADGRDARLGTAQLVVSCYLAGYAAGQVPCGLLADRYGRVPARPSGAPGQLLFLHPEIHA